MRSSSTVARCWWALSRRAWSGSWARRPTIARGRLGRGRCRTFRAVLVRPGGCGNGPASRDRCGATATATGRETAVGERPRCVPHHPGGAARLAPDLEPRGTALGAGRSGRSPGRAAQQQGHDPGAAVAAPCTWKKTATAFQQYERSEAGWKIAHAALQVFRPEGRLNERPWPQEQIARRCPSCRARVVQGPELPPGGGDVDILGSAAPSVAGGRT